MARLLHPSIGRVTVSELLKQAVLFLIGHIGEELQINNDP